MVRVLVAEDAAVTREYLVQLLEEDPGLRVVGTAADGLAAVEQAARLEPDVILMDVHMPRLNGFEATRLIMERTPTPIVIVTARYDSDDAALTFETLNAGALAVVEKPPGPEHPLQPGARRKLVETLKLMAEVKVVRRWPRRPRPVPPLHPPAVARALRLVAIGASTGGPAALAEILSQLPGDLPVPILVVQHIAAGFTRGLVDWLGQSTSLAVKIAEAGEHIRAGTVYFAPEKNQMGVSADGRIRLTSEPSEDGFCPAVSHLFASVAVSYGAVALGVLLSGMGRDGAAGLLALRRAGGVTLAQSEDTSVVFGMPAEAARLGAVQQLLSPQRIAEVLRALVRPA